MRIRAIEDRRFTDIKARTLIVLRRPNTVRLSFNIGRKFNNFKNIRNFEPYAGFTDYRFFYTFLKD